MVEAIADDLAIHGRPLSPRCGSVTRSPYARLASDLVAFKELLRAHASPDKPRPGAGEAARERLGEQLLDAVETNYRAAWPAGRCSRAGREPELIRAVPRVLI